MEIEKNGIIYCDIRGFLEKHFPDNFTESNEYEDCFHVTVYSLDIEGSSVWFEFDIENSELIVGFGVCHTHFGEQYGMEISKGFNQLFDFFTAGMRITDYHKGKKNFKSVYELKKENGTYQNFRTSSMMLLYPFWKKTTKKVTEYSELVKDGNIKKDLEKLRERINRICQQDHEKNENYRIE